MRNDVQFYVLTHDGDCEPDCTGNPMLFDIEHVKDCLERWDDVVEDPKSGRITSTGDSGWKAVHKTAQLDPVLESEAALSIKDRMALDPIKLAEEYKVTAAPTEHTFSPSLIDEIVNAPIPIKRGDVYSFVTDVNMVSNVCVGQDKSVSGFDHGLNCQFHFVPIK